MNSSDEDKEVEYRSSMEARFSPLPERAVKALKRMRNGALEALSPRILEADSFDEPGLG